MTRRLFCLLLLCSAFLIGCEPPDDGGGGGRKCCPSTATMIAFTASWCGPCHQQASIVNKIEAAGVRVIRIDIDVNPAAARRYRITSVPTYIYFECRQSPLRTHRANDILIRVQHGR